MSPKSHSLVSACSIRVFSLSHCKLVWLSLAVVAFNVGSLATARAEVKLPALFSDNMVLQQNVRVPVWGWANEGEQVTVSFRNNKVTAIAKAGKWQVTIARLKPGGPDQLTVAGKNTITLSNV